MEILFFLMFFFIILMPLVFGIVTPTFRNHNHASGGVINYDSVMKKFVYKVPLSKNEIISTLKISSDIDDLTCNFDLEKSTVIFSEYGSHREYYFYVEEYDNFSILRLEQTSSIGMSSHVPYKLNPFMISKLNAEIIPFSQYHF